MYEFDETDLQIVNLLVEDGRMPASEIARRIGEVSERAVRYRIDQLVAQGVVQIGAIINPLAFGLLVRADVWLEVDSDQIQAVARKLARQDFVTYVACGIGENDISIQLVTRDTQEIFHLVTDVIRKIPGVRKTTTSIVPVIVKDVYQWRVPERVAKPDHRRRNGRGARTKPEVT